MPPKSSSKLPPRSVSLGQRVWDLPEARDVIFRSMRGKKWVVGLLLSKATFLEAVQALYHIFDHKDLPRLNPRRICPSRYRLYLGSVRRLRYPLLSLNESKAAYLQRIGSTADPRQRLLEAIEQYPNVVVLFSSGNLWEDYVLILPSRDLSPGHRPIALLAKVAPAVFHCSHSALPSAVGTPDLYHVHWKLDPIPFLPPTWEVRYTFLEAGCTERPPDPPYRWLSWTWDDDITLLARASRIEIGAPCDGLDLAQILRLRANVDGAARLGALDAPALHLYDSPLRVKRDLAVQDLRMLHVPLSPTTQHLHYRRCYPLWGHPDVWSSGSGTQGRIPGVLELCMVHPAFPENSFEPHFCPSKKFATPTSSLADLQAALDKAKLYKEPRYWSERGHYPGRMKKIHVQLLIPLRLPDLSKARFLKITNLLFHCISPTRDEVARMLAAGGPKCEYRLSAAFYYTPSKEETEVAEVLSKRLMEALSQHRANIKAEQRNTKAKPRWRL